MTPENETVKASTLSRLFENDKRIEIQLGSIDTKMEEVIKFKDMIHEIIFGNGKPGLKSRLDTANSHIVKLWGFVVLLLTAIVSASLTAVVLAINKGG